MRLNRNNIRLPGLSQSVEPKAGLGLRIKKARKDKNAILPVLNSPVEFADSVIF